jgi:hypothetical protein
LPDRIVVVAVREPLEVFRATRAGGADDLDSLRGSLTSNHELQQRPRKIELVDDAGRACGEEISGRTVLAHAPS